MTKKASTSYDLPGWAYLLLGAAIGIGGLLLKTRADDAAFIRRCEDAGVFDDDYIDETLSEPEDAQDFEEIVEEIDELRSRHDFIFMCRGRGKGCTREASSPECPDCVVFDSNDERSTECIVKGMIWGH